VDTKRLPIRFSTWTLRHKKFKKDVRVAREVIVSGDDISVIRNNSLYLGRALRNIFGKGRWLKKKQDNMYDIVSIELSDKILGYTNVPEEKDEVRKQEDDLEWDLFR
jgi:hypothetical protein